MFFTLFNLARRAPACWGLGLVAALGVVGAPAHAGPVPMGLSITGTVQTDVVNSMAPVGLTTQTATHQVVSGGVSTADGFFGAPSSSMVQGALTQMGDGLGSVLTIAGQTDLQTDPQAGTPARGGPVFVDYQLNLSNSSAYTYTAVFFVDWQNDVTARGADSFARGQWSLFDVGNNELMATQHWMDTLNAADPSVNFNYDSAERSLSVTLAAGQNASFNALQQVWGGADSADGGFNVSLNVFMRLGEVTGGPGNTVPLPGTLALVVLGLALVRGSVVVNNRQKKESL